MFVACGSEISYLTLSEEHRMRVFDNRILKVGLYLRCGTHITLENLHNEKLHEVYSFTRYYFNVTE
jgi:hypothetical protein